MKRVQEGTQLKRRNKKGAKSAKGIEKKRNELQMRKYTKRRRMKRAQEEGNSRENLRAVNNFTFPIQLF